MTRPRLLDLFCGAGGAAMGYHRAGFDVVGVDIKPQPNYPFTFIQEDAINVLESWFIENAYDAIHASPPCQAYSSTMGVVKSKKRRRDALAPPMFEVERHPRLIEPTRDLLLLVGVPYVIENVPQAPLENPVTLCGSSFGLRVRRHRRFETNWPLAGKPCDHGAQGKDFVGVYGDHPERRAFSPPDGYERALRAETIGEARSAMGMPWANWHGVKEAIPPAYTEWIGEQLKAHLYARPADAETPTDTGPIGTQS